MHLVQWARELSLALLLAAGAVCSCGGATVPDFGDSGGSSGSSSGGYSGGSSGSSGAIPSGSSTGSSGSTVTGSGSSSGGTGPVVTCTSNAGCSSMPGTMCCGTKATGTSCIPDCGKEHPVCQSAADCPPGDTCHMEPGGYGLCSHPKVSDAGVGEGGADATTSDDGGDAAAD